MIVRRFAWLPTAGIVAGIVALLGTLGFLIYLTIDDYREQCHHAGGHIIAVRGEEICVDHDNRVVWI